MKPVMATSVQKNDIYLICERKHSAFTSMLLSSKTMLLPFILNLIKFDSDSHPSHRDIGQD